MTINKNNSLLVYATGIFIISILSYFLNNIVLMFLGIIYFLLLDYIFNKTFKTDKNKESIFGRFFFITLTYFLVVFLISGLGAGSAFLFLGDDASIPQPLTTFLVLSITTYFLKSRFKYD